MSIILLLWGFTLHLKHHQTNRAEASWCLVELDALDCAEELWRVPVIWGPQFVSLGMGLWGLWQIYHDISIYGFYMVSHHKSSWYNLIIWSSLIWFMMVYGRYIMIYHDISWYIYLNYFTSCDPHHDIYTFSYWQILRHSIWHIFWHSIWHYIWHIFWHMFWHIFWHSIWQIFWHSTWHIFWHSI